MFVQDTASYNHKHPGTSLYTAPLFSHDAMNHVGSQLTFTGIDMSGREKGTQSEQGEPSAPLGNIKHLLVVDFITWKSNVRYCVSHKLFDWLCALQRDPKEQKACLIRLNCH